MVQHYRDERWHQGPVPWLPSTKVLSLSLLHWLHHSPRWQCGPLQKGDPACPPDQLMFLSVPEVWRITRMSSFLNCLPSKPDCTDAMQDQGGRRTGLVGFTSLAHQGFSLGAHASLNSPSLAKSAWGTSFFRGKAQSGTCAQASGTSTSGPQRSVIRLVLSFLRQIGDMMQGG